MVKLSVDILCDIYVNSLRCQLFRVASMLSAMVTLSEQKTLYIPIS